MSIRKTRPAGESNPSGRVLIHRIYQELREQGFTRKQIREVVDATIAAWKKALANGESVEVPMGILEVVRSQPQRRELVTPPGSSKPLLVRINQRPHRVKYRPAKKALRDLNN